MLLLLHSYCRFWIFVKYSRDKYTDIIISQNTTQFYAQYVQISHNYMFRSILGHLQVVLFSLASVIAETYSCEIFVHIVHKIVLFWLIIIAIYLFIEHNGDVKLKSYIPENQQNWNCIFFGGGDWEILFSPTKWTPLVEPEDSLLYTKQTVSAQCNYPPSPISALKANFTFYFQSKTSQKIFLFSFLRNLLHDPAYPMLMGRPC
jgi:hypothetical protein